MSIPDRNIIDELGHNGVKVVQDLVYLQPRVNKY